MSVYRCIDVRYIFYQSMPRTLIYKKWKFSFNTNIFCVTHLVGYSHLSPSEKYHHYFPALAIKTINHTSYLSFLLHWQDFRKPNFTPKRRLKAPKTLKMSLKKSNICIFFHSIWKNLHLTENFYTDMSVVSVTNMRYVYIWLSKIWSGFSKFWLSSCFWFLMFSNCPIRH